MTRIITGTVSVDPGGSIVTAWSSTNGMTLSEITAPAGSTVVIEGRTNFIKARLSTTSFELMLPHAGDGGAGLDCAISALTAGEAQVGTLNARTATVIQQLGVLDANGRGLFYNLIGATGVNDPGPGRMAFNNADPELVTELYLDVLDANEGGREVSGLIGLWSAGAILIVRSIASTAYAAFQLNAAPGTPAAGYRKATCSFVGGDGTLAAEPVAIEWRLPGADKDVDATVPNLAGRAIYDNAPAEFRVLVENEDGIAFRYVKRSAAAADWSAGARITGASITLNVTEVDEVPYGVPPDVTLTPRPGGYDASFVIPLGMIIEPGATTTLASDQPAAVSFVPVAGGYRVDFAIPRGAAGDIEGVTPFWVTRLGTDADAAAARAGLGIVLADQPTAEAGTNNSEFMTPLSTAQAISRAIQSIVGIEPAMARWTAEQSAVRKFYGGNLLTSGSSGVSGGDSASGRTFVSGTPGNAVRQDGYVRTVKVHVSVLGTLPSGNIRFKVLRPNGSSYDFVAQSELLTATVLGFNTFNLANPLPVEPGDQIGAWLKGGADGQCSQITCSNTAGVGLVRYHLSDVVSGGLTYTEATPLALVAEFSGAPPLIVCMGESIFEGHNGASNWHSHYHTGPGGNPLAEPFNQVRALIPGLEYQNYAQGSTLWAGYVVKAASVGPYAGPRAVVIAGGLNDILAGTSWASVQASMNAWKAALPAGVKIFVMEIMPYTPGTDAQAATIRAWNANYASWCAANGAVLIPCWSAMGQLRPSTGFNDDQIAAHHYGGGHLTVPAGVDAYAALIAVGLKSALWI